MRRTLPVASTGSLRAVPPVVPGSGVALSGPLLLVLPRSRRDALSHTQQFNAVKPLLVFLCHSSDDKSTVRDLHRRLQDMGIQPWLDKADLLPGQHWREEIPKAVRSVDVMLVCLSHSSVNRAGYAQKEIKLALNTANEQPEGSIFVIPVLLDECTVPDRLNHLDWVKLFEEPGYEQLIQALRSQAERLGRKIPPGTDEADRIESIVVPPHRTNTEHSDLRLTAAGPSQPFQDYQNYSELLKAHRQTLKTYLYQRLMLGFMSPPGIRNGIVSTRVEIHKYKQYLRDAGIAVEDALDDDQGLLDLAWLYHLIPIALLTIISAGIWFLINTLVLKPTYAPMPDTGWNIVVAGIGVEDLSGQIRQDADGEQMSDMLYGMLKPQASNILDWRSPNVGYVLGDDDTRTSQAALIAARTNADLVVYGVVRRTTPGRAEFTPEFYVNRSASTYADEILGEDRFGQPVEFSLTSDTHRDDLKRRLDTLRLFFEGLQQHDEGDFDMAQSLYEEALTQTMANQEVQGAAATNAPPEPGQEAQGAAATNASPEPNQEAQVAAVIHLFLGALQVDIGRARQVDTNAAALEHYDAAWRLWPAYARLYLGRAAVLYQQALAQSPQTAAPRHIEADAFADYECFEIPAELLSSDAAYLYAALRCYEQAMSVPGQTATMDITAKATFGIGAVNFLLSDRQIVDRWSATEHVFAEVITQYQQAEPAAQHRLRQLAAHAFARQALAIRCPPTCSHPAALTRDEARDVMFLYKQAITLLQTYEPEKSCRETPAHCYREDLQFIKTYCSNLRAFAQPIGAETKVRQICPPVWDTIE